MNLQERVLGLLSCRFVDEVVIGAPWEITTDMLTTLNISVVAHGSVYDETLGGQEDYELAYRVPRERGLFTTVSSEGGGCIAEIIQRVRSRTRPSFGVWGLGVSAEHLGLNSHWGLGVWCRRSSTGVQAGAELAQEFGAVGGESI